MLKHSVFALLIAGLMYGYPSVIWGSERVYFLQHKGAFEVDVECDSGVTHIGVQHKVDGSQIDIGTVQRDNGTSKTTTTLLRSHIRSAIGKDLLVREGLLHSGIRSDRAQHDIASCLGLTAAETNVKSVHCAGNTCVCYPDEDSSCDLFDWICDATGGQSGHNICTW